MELLDVVTINREKTGKIVDRADLHLAAEEYVQVADLCIYNSEHQILIQRRQLSKSFCPGGWDFSCSGFVKSGETTRQTICREAREELGLRLDERDPQLAFTRFFKYVMNDFYIVEREVDIADLTLQIEEVMDARWATEDEILMLRSTGAFVDYEPEILHSMFDRIRREKRDDAF